MRYVIYSITNCNNPYTLWRQNLDGTKQATSNIPNNWTPSDIEVKETCNGVYRLIPKREAKSLFPLAFPPHTKD